MIIKKRKEMCLENGLSLFTDGMFKEDVCFDCVCIEKVVLVKADASILKEPRQLMADEGK